MTRLVRAAMLMALITALSVPTVILTRTELALVSVKFDVELLFNSFRLIDSHCILLAFFAR